MNHSILQFFFDAGLVVKIVVLLLLATSILSWTFIFQRRAVFQETREQLNQFEEHFWSGLDANHYYEQISSGRQQVQGINCLFVAGFREYKRLSKRGADTVSIMEGIQRAMNAAVNREVERLEQHLPFLASVGSTSPYVGLFGTVWGIMTAFSSLQTVSQATIAMVAPGISEALIATAIGLFAAIPAVIAYNRFSHQLDRILSRYDSFQEEFANSMRSNLLTQGSKEHE